MDAEDDLPPFAQGNGYDLGLVQMQAGNSTVDQADGPRFARFGSYSKARAEAEAAPRGAWQSCGGDFHAAR